METFGNSEHNTNLETTKIKSISGHDDENTTTSKELDVCHKTNGVSESVDTGDACTNVSEGPKIENNLISAEDIGVSSDNNCETTSVTTTTPTVDKIVEVKETTVSINSQDNVSSNGNESQSSETTVNSEQVCDVTEKDEELSAEVCNNDKVTFETEILIESNEHDPGNMIIVEDKISPQETVSQVLGQLTENTEFSEVLCSSDITGNGVNNNCAIAEQEVLNKKELLDILEGNDVEIKEKITETTGSTNVSEDFQMSESDKALQQLSRLKKNRKSKQQNKVPVRRKSDRKLTVTKKEPEDKQEESIVNALVKDWDDEEIPEDVSEETDQSNNVLEESKELLKETVELVKSQEQIKEQIKSEESKSPNPDNDPNVSKSSGDENTSQPQRRLSRIIKKKVIFDPDNPDTFTKSKLASKSKECSVEKEQPTPKKIKTDQTPQEPTCSSANKLQWKKPSSKSSKQCKRLTEVDKLLMDEGAVNMIYQLTSEAQKGKKNTKNKAEYIKKIQSSTPDTKEMKFRERKKETKGDECEAKRISGGKEQASMSSSVKSPSMSEDFEAHSADDSIIYRRHSSSSYSSSCMSPRRLSDVESLVGQTTVKQIVSDTTDVNNGYKTESETNKSTSETFLDDNKSIPKEVINKDDCLSIKQKLNSKLSLALNKRKRDSVKTDKPIKQRKLIKCNYQTMLWEELKNSKYVTVKIEDQFSLISIDESWSKHNIEVIKDLEKALIYIDSREDISVTLITTITGNLCLDLNLKALLTDNIDMKNIYGNELAESVRSLLQSLSSHKKLLCTGVENLCSGIGLAVVALSDLTFAAESSTFTLNSVVENSALLVPGVAVLNYLLPQHLVNDFVLFGRRLTATEAVQSGFVSRSFGRGSFPDQLRAVAKDIAAEPTKNVLLKKQLLSMKKNMLMESITSSLETEKQMFIEYWNTEEALNLIRKQKNNH